MPPTQHRALGLVASAALRDEIRQLVPDYEFAWNITLKGAIHIASDLRPSFLLVDITQPDTTWQDIVLALQTNPATRRIPMLALGGHLNDKTAPNLARYSLSGPIPRGDLAERLPDWVTRHARRWDEDYYKALADTCQDQPSAQAQAGIDLFNAHEFWEAHEALEHAWIEVRPHPIGEVYRSILQIGVAYYQIQKCNYAGAIKMFLRAIQWLDPLPDACLGIDLAQFKRDAAAARAHMEALGADRIVEFDTTYFKAVPRVSPDPT